MEAREGQVSPVFQDDKQTYLIALAVSDIYDDYRPYDSPHHYTMVAFDGACELTLGCACDSAGDFILANAEVKQDGLSHAVRRSG